MGTPKGRLSKLEKSFLPKLWAAVGEQVTVNHSRTTDAVLPTGSLSRMAVVKPESVTFRILPESNNDPYDLQRFVQAQRDDYAQALAEIRCGRKRSHWMWYIFPPLAGLGLSDMSQRYAIRSLAEADAYLSHPVLGPRLRECAEAVTGVEGRSAREIFGSPDDMKPRSCAPALRCLPMYRLRARSFIAF